MWNAHFAHRTSLKGDGPEHAHGVIVEADEKATKANTAAWTQARDEAQKRVDSGEFGDDEVAVTIVCHENGKTETTIRSHDA